MKRLVAVAVLGLSAWLMPSAQAQIFGPPGGGLGYGYPYGGYPYGYGGGLFGPGTLPGRAGMGVGQSPYNVVPTIIVPGATGGLGSPNETGHPTVFASYSRYFNNRGGGYVTVPSTTPVAGTAPARTFGAGQAGSRTPPARTNTGAVPPATP